MYLKPELEITSEYIYSTRMHPNIKKAKQLLEKLEKDDAPISISSVGYMNPMFTPMSDFTKKKKKKKQKGYLK